MLSVGNYLIIDNTAFLTYNHAYLFLNNIRYRLNTTRLPTL